MDDYHKERIRSNFRREEKKESDDRRHFEKMYELKKKNILDLERDRERSRQRREEMQIKAFQDEKMEERKRQERQEALERKNQVLYQAKEIDLEINNDKLEHEKEIHDREHKYRLREAQQAHQNEIDILNGKAKIDLELGRQQIDKELTLQKRHIKLELKKLNVNQELELKKEQIVTKRVIAIEEEQTSRSLRLAREQQQHEFVMAHIKNKALVEEKKLDLKNDIKRIKAETQAHQEKEDSALSRRILEGKAQLNNQLLLMKAEIAKLAYINELQKDLETHRFMLSQQSEKIDKETIIKYVSEIEDEEKYFDFQEKVLEK